MPEIYLIIVVLLFILAVSDLIVGVSNDAVNFLNSAVGSKVAPRKIIMIVATLGILVGATFSSGMMEVARKGIFNPEMFYFSEIMVIFLAVMLTDIILLDLFNTFGLPTSTTVSIVFELLGAAVVVAMIKLFTTDDISLGLADYINSSNAILIISGIFLSVGIAFTIGSMVQYVSRLLFTFHFQKRLKGNRSYLVWFSTDCPHLLSIDKGGQRHVIWLSTIHILGRNQHNCHPSRIFCVLDCFNGLSAVVSCGGASICCSFWHILTGHGICGQ